MCFIFDDGYIDYYGEAALGKKKTLYEVLYEKLKVTFTEETYIS